MKKILILLLLALVAATQAAPKCGICQKVPNCPKELFNDGFVDPIFNFIVQQVSISSSPTEIKRQASQTQANYTFVWSSQAYLAVVDLSTNKFKVMAIQQPQEVVGTQNNLGLRESTNSSSASSTQ